MNDFFKDKIEKANIIVEALPYINAFRGKTVVIKYGGNAMNDINITRTILQDVAALKIVGVKPILVHGGGPEINLMLHRLNIEPKFEKGLRVTDKATMEIVQMVLCGKLNKNLVSQLGTFGVKAIGLCGKDGRLIEVTKADENLGYVGEIQKINSHLLEILSDDEYIPVIAPIGIDAHGESYNINADSVAGAIGGALNAEKLLYLTDVDGIYKDASDKSTLINKVSASQIKQMIKDGTINGGMIPKVEGCLNAIEQGLKNVLIVNGVIPHAILLELFTDSGIGTMITS